MFHYRPALSGKRARALVAVSLAIAAHAGIMSLSVEQTPTQAPQVSIPRSVSVFLSWNNEKIFPDAPQQDRAAAGITGYHEAGREPQEEKTVYTEAPGELAKTENVIPKQAVPQKNRPPDIETENGKNRQKLNSFEAEPPHPSEAVQSSAVPITETRVAEAVPAAPTVKEVETAPETGVLQSAYPRYQMNRPPLYPLLARKRGQQGTVMLQVLVNNQGRVHDLEIELSSGFSLLDRAAVTAVRKWVFEPGQRGEDKVQMWVRVPVTFRLDQ